jgi:peptide/nickel transport system ATP-binding protein
MSLLEVRDLVVHFPITEGLLFERKVGAVQAVDGVDLDIQQGETLGLVGESGCGKSTVSKAILRLVEPTAGTVSFDGKDVTGLGAEELRRLRRRMQMIFQDPYSSLDPRQSVGSILSAPRSTSACASCSRWWACRPRPAAASRTSSPAGSASASASPAPWRCGPT